MPRLRHHHRRHGHRHRRHRAPPDPFNVAVAQRPSSSGNRIVFPWNHASNSFSREDYDPVFYGDRVDESDVNMMLGSLRKSPEYKRKTFLKSLLIIPAIACCFVILLLGPMIILLNSGYATTLASPWFILVLVCLFICLMIALVSTAVIINGKKNKHYRGRETDFGAIVREKNQRYFNKKGLNWKVGKFGSYLTCTIMRKGMRANQPRIVEEIYQNDSSTTADPYGYEIGGSGIGQVSNIQNSRSTSRQSFASQL